MSLWFALMHFFTVLLPVVVHVSVVLDIFNQLGVFKVAIDWATAAVFKGDPGMPSQGQIAAGLSHHSEASSASIKSRRVVGAFSTATKSTEISRSSLVTAATARR